MRIVFLCGAVEPGRNGVGDYTRRLAASLTKIKHLVYVVSLNDGFVKTFVEELQTVDGENIPTLRIPSTCKENDRFLYLRKWIKKHPVDVISLQYVSFAFHKKGLSLTLPGRLKTLASGVCWHIMFHELWVGMYKEAGFKLVVWGGLQRLLVRRLLTLVKPRVVHSHTWLYIHSIRRMGFNCKHLSLFSNIPVAEGHKRIGSSHLIFVLFGAIHADAPALSFAEELYAFSKLHDNKILLQIIGSRGQQTDYWIQSFKHFGFEVEFLGMQTEERISEIFLNADIGLSTTPFALAEKSGAVAAMIAHGLPVLCVRDKWIPRITYKAPSINGITEYRNGMLAGFLSAEKKGNTNDNIDLVARKFVEDLS